MRDIKFRAWDKKNKAMVTVWGINWTGFDGKQLSSFFAVNPVINGEYILKEQDAELMQYTGVNDTNGIEVYEGDRVTVQDDVGLGFGHPQGPTWSGIIELDAGRFTLNMGNSRLDCWMDAQEIYVTGNKYE